MSDQGETRTVPTLSELTERTKTQIQEAMSTSRGETMSIGELAERAGVSTRTIRYYEQVGVLPPPPRSEGKVRRYPPVYITYLEGALALKDLDFSLEDIAILTRLMLNIGPPLTKKEQEAALKMAAERLERLERRLEVFQNIRRLLLKSTGK